MSLVFVGHVSEAQVRVLQESLQIVKGTPWPCLANLIAPLAITPASSNQIVFQSSKDTQTVAGLRGWGHGGGKDIIACSGVWVGVWCLGGGDFGEDAEEKSCLRRHS